MSVTLEQANGLNEIRLEGIIDICCAAELKALLIQALSPGVMVGVSPEAADDLDITAFQLLWAAERESRKLGGGLSFTTLVLERISHALTEAGFEKFSLSAGEKCDSEADTCQP